MNRDADYSKENNLILSVAKKYYENHMNQEDIAQEEFISKSSVSRLIKKAWERGFVKCNISYPNMPAKLLEDEFYKRFKLFKVYIDPQPQNGMPGAAIADDIFRLADTGGILALASVTVLNSFVAAAIDYEGHTKNLSAVVLTSGIGDNFEVVDMVSKAAKAFSAQGYVVPAPLVAESPEIKDMYMRDSHISYVFDLIKESNYIVAEITDGVGGAAGCIAGHYFDENGNIFNEELDSRTVTLPLDDIKNKDKRAVVAVGEGSARAILGAINGGIINMLYTDAPTAKAVIDIINNY